VSIARLDLNKNSVNMLSMRATTTPARNNPRIVDPDRRRPAGAALRRLEDSLPISLLRAREAVMAHFRPQLLENDLSEQQWRVIRVLAEGGQTDAGTVASRSCIHPASLSRILRSLQKRKLLRTSPSRADSRRLLVELAPAGRQLFEKMAPVSESIYRQLEVRLGKALLTDTLQFVKQISARLREEASP
jgi:homoprotocatechuate degradation regulator HpaR